MDAVANPGYLPLGGRECSTLALGALVIQQSHVAYRVADALHQAHRQFIGWQMRATLKVVLKTGGIR